MGSRAPAEIVQDVAFVCDVGALGPLPPAGRARAPGAGKHARGAGKHARGAGKHARGAGKKAVHGQARAGGGQESSDLTTLRYLMLSHASCRACQAVRQTLNSFCTGVRSARSGPESRCSGIPCQSLPPPSLHLLHPPQGHPASRSRVPPGAKKRMTKRRSRAAKRLPPLLGPLFRVGKSTQTLTFGGRRGFLASAPGSVGGAFDATIDADPRNLRGPPKGMFM